MKLIGLTLAMMVATSCLVRPSEGIIITTALGVAGLGAAATVGGAALAGTATLGAAGLAGAATVGTALIKTETGGKVLKDAYNSASDFADYASCFFFCKRK